MQRARIAVAVGAALLLAGCTPAPAPTVAPTVSETPSPSVTPSTTPDAAPTPTAEADGPLALPACVDLLPLSTAQAQLGGDTVSLDIWATAAEVMPGPAAAAAVSTAEQSVICAWGIPNSDGGFHVVAAELTRASAESLIAQLRAAGTFAEQSVPGGASFSRDLDSELGSFAVSYVFVDTAWVTAVGSLTAAGARTIATTAMDAVTSAG